MRTAGNIVRFKLNGKEETVPWNTSLRDFLLSRRINQAIVACELNLKIIRRTDLESTILNDGDTLEIIQMVGGG